MKEMTELEKYYNKFNEEKTDEKTRSGGIYYIYEIHT